MTQSIDVRRRGVLRGSGITLLSASAVALLAGSEKMAMLQKPVLEVAVLFQTHHKQHRDALIATIRKLGGTPVAPRSDAEVAKALNASALKTQSDVLRLAQRLEKGAANAYIGVIPSFGDRSLAQVSARLAADETMHWTALSGALQDPLPAKALSFGA